MYTKHRFEQKHIRKVGAGTLLYDSSLVTTGEQESQRIEEKNLEVVRYLLLSEDAWFMQAQGTDRLYSHQDGYKAKFWLLQSKAIILFQLHFITSLGEIA